MRKKAHTLRNVLLLIVGLPIAAVVVLLMTFDANTYRPQISSFLSEHIGRPVRIEGPVALSISWSQGFHLNVKDISVDNPSWASRPVMASIGDISLGVALPPLLQKRAEVTSFALADADILLETNAAGANNWDLKAAASQAQSPEAVTDQRAEQGGTDSTMSFQINAIKISNTKLSKREKDGKVSGYFVKNLAFAQKGMGVEIKADAEIDGVPVGLNVSSPSSARLDKIIETNWPFEGDLRYDKIDMKLAGTLNGPQSALTLDRYSVSSGGSKIDGQMIVAFGGARPDIKGTVNSQKVDPSDFKMGDKKPPAAETSDSREASGTAKQDRIFSTEPLALDGLKAADARLDIKIARLVAGPSEVKDLETKLDLTNGRLLLSPFKAMVADKAVEGQIMIGAQAKPAQVVTMLKAYQIDLSELVKLGGLSSFIESKGDADLDLTTQGNSLHELASNANGSFNLVMAGGKVSQQIAGELAGDLLNILAPGTGGLTKPGLNCFVAHFKITNGLVQSQGLLMDTAQATVAGTGSVNLRDETMDMVLRARTKGVEVGNLVPPLRVSGPLKKLSYKPDAAGTVEKVVGLFRDGTLTDGGVPEIIQQEGHNACEYTLKNPRAAAPAQAPVTVNEAVDKAKEKVKDVGDKLLRGLGGVLGQ